MNVPYFKIKYTRPGDADNDGTVDINDVEQLRNHLVNVKTANTVNSDINFDGNIDIVDLSLLIKKLQP